MQIEFQSVEDYESGGLVGKSFHLDVKVEINLCQFMYVWFLFRVGDGYEMSRNCIVPWIRKEIWFWTEKLFWEHEL